MLRSTVAVLTLTTFLASPARAQMPMGDQPTPSTPWAAQNKASMAKMGKAMSDTAPASNEDHAFVEGMLPHHQGAVDMARTELAYGHNLRMKQLAKSIIAAQEREISIMQAWLKAHPDGT